MKKVIRLNENDLENLVKKILKEESVNPEWFESVSEPSNINSFLFELFNSLNPHKAEEYKLTFYLNQNDVPVMIERNYLEGPGDLFLDSTRVVKPLDAMGLNDEEVELSIKKVFKEVFGDDIGTVNYSIPGSYLHAYANYFLL